MMVVPAETVEETLDELLSFCVEGDIIIDHGNSNFKDSRRRAEREHKLGIQYLDCGTSGGVYATVDTVLWLVVQILQYPPAVHSLMHSVQASVPHLEPMTQTGIFSTLKSMDGSTLVRWCRSFCKDGSQWNRIRNHASPTPRVLISCMRLMLGQFMLKRAMLRLLRWRIRKIIVTTLTLLKWLSVGGAVALLGLGYLTLLRMYYAGIEASSDFAGASQIVGRVVGLSMLLWTLAYPLLSSVVRCGHVLSRAVLVLSPPRF